MWDTEFEPPPCSIDRAAPLLEQTLALAGLEIDTFVFTTADFEESTQYNNGVLGGDFALSWLWDARADAARAGCVDGRLAGGLDHGLAQAHPVAAAIRHAAGLLDRPPDDAEPLGGGEGFAAALDELCATVGSACEPEGELPPALADALAPILRAVHEGIAARLAMDQEQGGNPSFWWADGGNHLILQGGAVADAADPAARAYMLGEAGRARLYRAASQIAFAVEDVDWSQFAGETVSYRVATAAGEIVVADGSAQTYEEGGPDTLLLVDLGGDDEHLDEVASNRSETNPVSIVIDVAGDDRYGYTTVETPYDEPGLEPADEDGRAAPNGTYGAFTLSSRFRQGAARNGIAMLFDLGGDDEYRSLRGSQGYAHFGVGVLYDADGRDIYVSEALSQGSAQFGIGLLIDAGDEDDDYRAFTHAQGFGFTAGLGALVDASGDDVYDCDVGDPDYGGLPIYYSPQMPGVGNTSSCQGMGFGSRNDSSALSSLAGGVGILRDLAGDDEYSASLFAQGSGYWEGIGLLSDGGGSDRYDGFWYVQGGVAHYAVGMLMDDGDGDDLFNQERPNRSVNSGTGHDYSLGVLVNEAGNDAYRITGLSAGSSNCNGIGLFVDNAGDDTYEAINDYNSGMGNVSNECLGTRPDAVSIGVMIDAGGTDSYTYPDTTIPEFIVPTDGGTWGHARHGLPTEHGAGIDAENESGIHPESG